MSMSISKMNAVSISILLTLLLITLACYISDSVIFFSNTEWSQLFFALITIIYILRYVNKISATGLYSIFFISFLLFICGRFFSILLDSKLDIFLMDFFVTYRLNSYEITKLILMIFISIISMEIGLYAANIKTLKSKKLLIPKVNSNKSPPKFIIITSILIIFSLNTLLLLNNLSTVVKYGYVALYSNQGEAIQAGWTSLLITFTYVFLGIVLTHSTRKTKALFLILFGISSVIQALIGVRGAIGIFLLFLLWVKYDYGKKKPNTLVLYSLFISFILFMTIVIPQYSYRVLENETGPLTSVTNFLYSQGFSMLVFHSSMKLEHYSIIPALQSFIPGSSFIISLTSHELPSYYTSFSRYLSYHLSPSLYNQGFGLGWSILSDFYIFSGRTIIGFILLSFLWGYGINKAELLAQNNLNFKRILITVAPSIIFIPRSGISTVFPLIIYAIIIFFIINSLKKSN